MNILSIDWDYFFPDNFNFDWAMDEKTFVYYEMLWPIRWGHCNLYDHKIIAKDVYHPDPQLLNGFLDKILINSSPALLSIADSHTDIQHLINLFPAKVNIYNFDQHHDIHYYGPGYLSNDMKLDCGNWVGYFRNQINSYHLIYPSWRKDNQENQGLVETFASSVSFTIPESPPNFDMIFICRSSPWTPSWSDNHWIKFIQYFKANHSIIWDNKLALDYALKSRPFNQKEADQYLKQTKASIEYCKKMNRKENK